MRVHLIEDNDSTVLFLPDTLKFFEINSFTKNVIEDMKQGLEDQDICEKHQLNVESLNQIKKMIDNKDDRVKLVTAQKEGTLFRLIMNVTNKCNLACKYCYANGGNYCSEENVMCNNMVDEILNKMYDRYPVIQNLQLFGGEPTLNLDAIERVGEFISENYASGRIKEKPLLGLVTNGTIVNDRFVDLINKYEISVTVSLDGPEKVNDIMRVYEDGSGTTKVIEENIKILKEKTNQPTGIEATYNKHHIDQDVSVVDVLSYVHDEFKIDNIHIVPAGGDEDCDFVAYDRSTFVDSVEDIFSGINGKSVVSYSAINKVVSALTKRKANKFLCEAGLSVLSVSTKGDVYPCFMLTDVEAYKMGNIRNDDFFESAGYNSIRKDLSDFSKFEDDKCKDCFNNTVCSGCLGLNYFETGNIHEQSDMNCDMYKEMTEQVILQIIKQRKTGKTEAK